MGRCTYLHILLICENSVIDHKYVFAMRDKKNFQYSLSTTCLLYVVSTLCWKSFKAQLWQFNYLRFTTFTTYGANSAILWRHWRKIPRLLHYCSVLANTSNIFLIYVVLRKRVKLFRALLNLLYEVYRRCDNRIAQRLRFCKCVRLSCHCTVLVI